MVICDGRLTNSFGLIHNWPKLNKPLELFGTCLGIAIIDELKYDPRLPFAMAKLVAGRVSEIRTLTCPVGPIVKTKWQFSTSDRSANHSFITGTNLSSTVGGYTRTIQVGLGTLNYKLCPKSTYR